MSFLFSAFFDWSQKSLFQGGQNFFLNFFVFGLVNFFDAEFSFLDLELIVEVFLGFYNPVNRLLGQRNPFDNFVFFDFCGPRFHHDNSFFSSHDHHIERALLELFHGGINNKCVVHITHFYGSNWSGERNVRKIKSGGSADDSQRVRFILQVSREEKSDDLGVEEISIGKK